MYQYVTMSVNPTIREFCESQIPLLYISQGSKYKLLEKKDQTRTTICHWNTANNFRSILGRVLVAYLIKRLKEKKLLS